MAIRAPDGANNMGPIWYTKTKYQVIGYSGCVVQKKLRGPGLKKISVAVGYLIALNSTVDIFQPGV